MGGILHTAPNKVGARQTLEPATSGPGPLKPILQVSGRHEHAGHLAVVLAPVISDFTRGPIVHPCVAVVTWGTGGASTKAEVDFARGTQLQFAASFVSISGRNDGAVDDGTGNPIDPSKGPQDVIAMLSGLGSRPAFGRVTRTFHFGEIPTGQSRQVPIPPFAKVFLISRFPSATAIDVTVFDGFITTVDDVSGVRSLSPVSPRDEYAFGSGVPAQRTELFDRAGALRVANTGEGSITALEVSFELAL